MRPGISRLLYALIVVVVAVMCRITIFKLTQPDPPKDEKQKTSELASHVKKRQEIVNSIYTEY